MFVQVEHAFFCPFTETMDAVEYIGKQRRSCSDYLDAQADLGTCHLHRTRALFLHCTSSGPSCSKLNKVVS